ncbi:MAG TPA: hypothetical protein VHO68_05700 [Bacteroidales bacterium]|nr:hypothetical protein [Bacteroidales bacterium]
MLFVLVLASLFFILPGCSGLKRVERKNIYPDSTKNLNYPALGFSKDAYPYLKAHMKNGNLYVLQDWKLDDSKKNITGSGRLYDPYRNSLYSGMVSVNADSVAIFETNTLEMSPAMGALTVFTGITAAVTLYCIINPKACFGSCPTFYIHDGDSLRLQAEGFSSSISPSMEATDIDALYHAKTDCDEYSLEMRNEAMETHVVRSAKLLCVEKSEKDNRIYYSPDGAFWESDSILPPYKAMGPEGDCTDKLMHPDDVERFSRADSINLGEKEIVELDFRNVPDKNLGLILGCRQTLLSTYLLYQTFAYMGTDAAYWIAQIERNKINVDGNEMLGMLGGIEVLVQDLYGRWKIAGVIDEFGPLATDFHIIPIKEILEKNTKIRLRMTKGYWRIDYAALASVTKTEKVSRVEPMEVLRDGKTDENARAMLCDSSRTLVTLPGDTYELRYRIPTMAKNYELFIESRGYYLEWIRKEWMKEENPSKLAEILLNPKEALKRLAPEFKKVEPKMESAFWRSRYAKP